MKPPFAYFGGKIRLASWIVSMFPPHTLYVEPFCGSAAVLFAKERSRDELINDVHGDVINFYKVLRDRPDELELACALTPYARDEWQQVMDAVDGPLVSDLERARRWFVRSTQTYGRIGNGRSGWSVSMKQNTNAARSVFNAVGRFADAAIRLQGVTVESSDALEVIRRFDDPNALHYIDPPYLGETRTSFAEGDKRRPSGDYEHEFESEEDHRELAKALHECAGAVFLSGYPSALYDRELYADWSRYERGIVSQLAHEPRVEVVWSNRPAYGVLF